MHPRAHRYAIVRPLRYRLGGQGGWRDGRTVNMSHTGVLFECGESIHRDTPLELALVLMASREPARLLTRGLVVRQAAAADRTMIAVRLAEYRFVRGAAL